MAYQNRENLAYATVAVGPSPALSGTSLTVANGLGSLFPTSDFQITVYPPGVDPLMSNAEICNVTTRVGDVFTIVRAQEGTTAKSIATGWQVANTITKKAFTDIQDSIIQSVWAGGVAATAPQISFSNSNGVSFGAAGSVITASVDTGGGGSINFSAGTQSSNLQSLVFSNSNGVSFGLSNGTITASASAAGGGAGLSAGTQSVSTGTVVFSNSNGISFGMSNSSIITASHNGLTSQSNQAFSAQGGSSAFQTLSFGNSNGLTFSNSNGSVVGSYTVPNTAGLISIIGLSGGTQSNQVTAIVFSNTNGVSFGVNGSTVTASIAAGAAAGSISAGTTSVALGQAVFSNSNGVTFGLDGSTVTASHNGLTSQSNQAASASNGSFAFQTLAFSNANNVTFGTSAGGIITASVAPSGGGSVNFSAGTTSNNLATIVFSNSNGITFGLNGSTITASFAPSGGVTFSRLMPFPYYLGLAQIMTNGSLTVMPVDIANAVQFDRIVFQQILNNATITATQSHTRAFGFYTNNAGTLSLVFSHTDESTWNFNGTVNFTNSFNGHRIQVMTFNSTSLSAGQYYFGLVFSSTFSSTQNAPQFVVNTFFASNFTGIFGQASNTTIQRTMGAGIFTATTANIPSSIAISDIEGNPSQAQRIPNWHLALSTV